jgi:hypothetical protein
MEQVGRRVQPGEQLLTLVPLNDIWITADFRETQLWKMRPGEPVTVHVDTTGRDYNGYVEGISGATGESRQPAASGKRDRQLRQGRAAIAGEDSPLPGRGSGPQAARWNVSGTDCVGD